MSLFRTSALRLSNSAAGTNLPFAIAIAELEARNESDLLARLQATADTLNLRAAFVCSRGPRDGHRIARRCPCRVIGDCQRGRIGCQDKRSRSHDPQEPSKPLHLRSPQERRSTQLVPS